MSTPKTLSEALCRIYTEFGPDCLRNPNRLIAVFADIAPTLWREREQLNLLIRSGSIEKLSAAANLPAGEVRELVHTVSGTLCDTYLMDRTKAEMLCNTYVKALSGKLYAPTAPTSNTLNPNGSNTVTGSKIVKTTTSPKTGTTTKTTPPPPNPNGNSGCLILILFFLLFAAGFSLASYLFAINGFATPGLNAFLVMIGLTFLFFHHFIKK